MVYVEYIVDYLGYKVVRARQSLSSDTALEVLTRDGWKKKDKMKALEFDETMLWDREDLTELVTKLAELGVKPKDVSFTEGKLQATEKHLEDMRTLVLKKD